MARREKVKEVPVSYIRKVRLVEKTCPVCGKKFEGVKIRKFCSRTCQQKADYARHGETYRQLRMESYRRQKEQEAKK